MRFGMGGVSIGLLVRSEDNFFGVVGIMGGGYALFSLLEWLECVLAMFCV